MPSADAAEPDRIELVAGETIQWAVGPPVARIVAVNRALVRNEQIVDRVFVARRAAQAERMPDVVKFGARFGIQEGLRLLGARDPQMRAEPGRVLTAAHEPPFAGDAIAALDRRGLIWRAGRPPRHDPIRPAENLLRHVRFQIGAGGRAAVALTHHPPRRAIRARDRLRHLGEDRGLEFHPADGLRLQHGEKATIDQRFDDGLREFPDFVVLRRGGGEHRLKVAGLLDLRMDSRHGVSPASATARPRWITHPPGAPVKRWPHRGCTAANSVAVPHRS